MSCSHKSIFGISMGWPVLFPIVNRMVAHYHIIFEPFIRVFDFDHDNWQLDCMMIIVFSYCFYHSCLCMCFDSSVSKVYLISISLSYLDSIEWIGKFFFFFFLYNLLLVEYSGYWFSAVCFVPKDLDHFIQFFVSIWG